MVDGGYDCIDRATWAGTGYCTQLASNITKTGKIESWCTYMHAAGTMRLRIYRLSGSQYLYIGGSSKSCSVGYQSHTCDIDVQSGDIVGVYMVDGSVDCDTTYSNAMEYKTHNVDVNFDSPTSDWNVDNWAYTWSVGVTVTVSYTDYYVKTTGDDSKDGGSWANAWKTINKAATTVADGSTVHIEYGTYNAEPAGNKIAPQNVGTSGIYYSPEGGSSPHIVSVEQNP